MIAKLLPESVVVEEAAHAVVDRLLPEEAVLMENSTPRRRVEFATGRACARAALRRLGYGDVAILVGQNREPLWPSALVGSITHCPGYCAAAVARAADIASVGIDAEEIRRLTSDIVELITSPGERAAFPGPVGDWLPIVFSAKEAAFKAWFPLGRRRLDHRDVNLRIDSSRRAFVIDPVDQGMPDGGVLRAMRGAFTSTRTHIFTSVVVKAERGLPHAGPSDTSGRSSVGVTDGGPSANRRALL